MKEIIIKKGTIIQKVGDLNTKVYLVKSGLLRSYTIDQTGKENIFMFAPENWVIADANAPDTPAVLFIDALEDATVMTFPKDFNRERAHIEAIVKRLNILQNRILMLTSTQAIERYQHFIRTYPNIAQRVPQRMIAFYLGVTPETLSAAKSKYLSQQK